MTKHSRPSLYPEREFKSPELGTTYCSECHAVHHKKHWALDEDLYKRMVKDGVESTVCRGCRMVEEELYEGHLQLHWKRLETDQGLKNELISLVHNKESEEREKNPLNRIVSIEDQGDTIVILTSTKFLASHLGHAVDSAYNGSLKINHVQRGTVSRVTWTRE